MTERFASLLKMLTPATQDPVYVVGGFLRDHLLGKSNPDLDLAISGPVEPYAKNLTRKLGGTLVLLDDKTQVYRVVLPQSLPAGRQAKSKISQIDVAQMQGKDILEDLVRRDFTINAMALLLTPHPSLSPKGRGNLFYFPRLPQGERTKVRGLLDPFGGLEDLKKKTVRLVSPRALEEDPLRLLRAFRIAAELDFKIDPSTLKEIKKHASKVRKPSPERIQMEITRLLEAPQSTPWLKLMDQTGLLTALFPELEPSRRCATVYYGSGGVLKHSLTTVERMEYLLQNLRVLLPQLHTQISSSLQEAPASLLKFTALFHDVAKPKTAKKIKGRLRFFGHEEEGGKMTAHLMEKLRFSRAHIHISSTAIRHHLRPGNLAANPVISDKAVFRFFRDLGSVGVPLLLICWSDHASYLTLPQLKKIQSRLGNPPEDTLPIKKTGTEKTLRHLQVVGYLLKCYYKRKKLIAPDKIIDGNDVMKSLQLKPSPLIGEILNKLREAQAEGKVKNREEALSFIQKFAKSNNHVH